MVSATLVLPLLKNFCLNSEYSDVQLLKCNFLSFENIEVLGRVGHHDFFIHN